MTSRFEVAAIKPDRNIRIVIDTREKEGYTFSVPTVLRKLDAGDYSLEGLETKVAVERKSKSDFVSTVIHNRRRFYKELNKLSNYDQACVVVEAHLRDIVVGNYRNRAHPNSLIGAITTIIVDFRVPVYFCSDRQVARHFVEKYLTHIHRRYT